MLILIFFLAHLFGLGLAGKMFIAINVPLFVLCQEFSLLSGYQGVGNVLRSPRFPRFPLGYYWEDNHVMLWMQWLGALIGFDRCALDAWTWKRSGCGKEDNHRLSSAVEPVVGFSFIFISRSFYISIIFSRPWEFVVIICASSGFGKGIVEDNHARLWMQWLGALIGFVTYNAKFLLVFGFGNVYGYACSSVCVSGAMQPATLTDPGVLQFSSNLDSHQAHNRAGRVKFNCTEPESASYARLACNYLYVALILMPGVLPHWRMSVICLLGLVMGGNWDGLFEVISMLCHPASCISPGAWIEKIKSMVVEESDFGPLNLHHWFGQLCYDYVAVFFLAIPIIIISKIFLSSLDSCSDMASENEKNLQAIMFIFCCLPTFIKMARGLLCQEPDIWTQEFSVCGGITAWLAASSFWILYSSRIERLLYEADTHGELVCLPKREVRISCDGRSLLEFQVFKGKVA
ncbi:hypothetical protein RIF29_16773 [Crotalaria pallida]|uniref:Uncharacterized protein n=1 Tax=Crotalaria pallida TaxID=3830 RepID=A0AAN9FN14_CROPI